MTDHELAVMQELVDTAEEYMSADQEMASYASTQRHMEAALSDARICLEERGKATKKAESSAIFPLAYWQTHEKFTRSHGAMQSALCSLLIALDQSLKSAGPGVQPPEFKLDVRSAYDRLLHVLGP